MVEYTMELDSFGILGWMVSVCCMLVVRMISHQMVQTREIGKAFLIS